jgi:hypothetical protein
VIADWKIPFNLTSAYSSSVLPINQESPGSATSAGTAVHFVTGEGAEERHPTGGRAILHRRFTSGMEMDLAIQLWETTDQPACDERRTCSTS